MDDKFWLPEKNRETFEIYTQKLRASWIARRTNTSILRELRIETTKQLLPII